MQRKSFYKQGVGYIIVPTSGFCSILEKLKKFYPAL